jgi:hypothetical protein
LVAGVSEGHQAGRFRSAADIQLEVHNTRSMDEAKTAVAGAVGRGRRHRHRLRPGNPGRPRGAPGVPIVVCPVADPVAARLVASAEAPGGNLTGVASADAEASLRQLRAFHKVVPGLQRLGTRRPSIWS